MANKISYTIVFEKYFKRYSKKYRSLASDLKELENILLKNPKYGVDLG
jgi:mRNA-degrading endonuclease YafQ of YafQ-DinJ toxin-antitoxin module